MAHSSARPCRDNAETAATVHLASGCFEPGSLSAGLRRAMSSTQALRQRKSIFALVVYFADVMLRVQLKTKLGNEIKLGFEEIDVAFLVRHKFIEQVARDIVPHGVAMRCRFLVERAGRDLRRQIAV